MCRMKMYETISLALVWILIFVLIHIAFKNIKQLCILSCKIITTTYLWFVVWVATQLHRLPEWELSFKESVTNIINGSLFDRASFDL